MMSFSKLVAFKKVVKFPIETVFVTHLSRFNVIISLLCTSIFSRRKFHKKNKDQSFLIVCMIVKIPTFATLRHITVELDKVIRKKTVNRVLIKIGFNNSAK